MVSIPPNLELKSSSSASLRIRAKPSRQTVCSAFELLKTAVLAIAILYTHLTNSLFFTGRRLRSPVKPVYYICLFVICFVINLFITKITLRWRLRQSSSRRCVRPGDRTSRDKNNRKSPGSLVNRLVASLSVSRALSASSWRIRSAGSDRSAI